MNSIHTIPAVLLMVIVLPLGSSAYAQSCNTASVTTAVNYVMASPTLGEWTTFDLTYAITVEGAETDYDYGYVVGYGEPAISYFDCNNNSQNANGTSPWVTFAVSQTTSTSVVFSITQSAYQWNATMCLCGDKNPNGYKSLSPAAVTPALVGTFTTGC